MDFKLNRRDEPRRQRGFANPLFDKKGIKIPPPKILTEVFLFTIGFKSFYVESSRLNFFSVTMRTFISDNSGITANRISVDRVID